MLAEPEKSNSLEQPGKSSKHSGKYYEFISSQGKISRTGYKLLTFMQIIQELQVALVQEQAGNTSENLLNIKWNISNQIFILSSKRNTKKVYNKIML